MSSYARIALLMVAYLTTIESHAQTDPQAETVKGFLAKSISGETVDLSYVYEPKSVVVLDEQALRDGTMQGTSIGLTLNQTALLAQELASRRIKSGGFLPSIEQGVFVAAGGSWVDKQTVLGTDEFKAAVEL